jgi:hypothetical protein
MGGFIARSFQCNLIKNASVSCSMACYIEQVFLSKQTSICVLESIYAFDFKSDVLPYDSKDKGLTIFSNLRL